MNLQKLPKIELHIHLEGSIPHTTLWKIIQKYGGDPTVPTLTSLQKKFEYKNFREFIESWSWKNQFLREYEDFELISEEFAKDLASQNVKYAEVFFSPSLFKKYNLNTQKITESVNKGISKVNEIKINLIADLVRDYGQEKELITLKELSEVKNFNLIGIGIGGTEPDYPPEQFTEIYEQARSMDFKTTVHAGEASGAESIWAALNYLRPDRIGHATRANEDPALMEYLSNRKIPVELCILSNLKTGVISSVYEHPVKEFRSRGIPFSINTDDPKMFGNSLNDEYEALQKYFGCSDREIIEILLDSIETTWLPDNEKTELKSNFETEIKKLFI
ncbi:adenosine deaminase [candidate division KSB1 bacterium]